MGVAKNHSDHHRNFLAWTENRKYDFICLVSNQLKAIGKHIDPRIVGVLYDYVRNYSNDSRVRLVIESWLAANLLNEEELNLVDFPSNQSIDTEDKAKELIKGLGVITHFSRPIFLCFDQVETYILNDKAFKAFMKAVEYVQEYTFNYAVVVSALLTFDEKLRTSGLTPSTWDRFNYKSKPIVVHPLSPDEAKKLVEARLVVDFGSLFILSKKRFFPFCSKDLDEILTPAGAKTPTYKQARYVLEDAGSLFDEILMRRPSPQDVERYFRDDRPLHQPAELKPRRPDWPTNWEVESFLTKKMAAAIIHYQQHPEEVRIDENRNREIVLDLLFRAISMGGGRAPLVISDLAVSKPNAATGCDFTLTVLGADAAEHAVGVVFCDDPRANVIKSLTRKAMRLLISEAVERIVYVRDARIRLTSKSRQILQDFEDGSKTNSARVVMCGVDERNLHHLRAMRRLCELAGGDDLTMRNTKLKQDYRVSQDKVTEYFLSNNCLLCNGLIMTILTGSDHCKTP